MQIIKGGSGYMLIHNDTVLYYADDEQEAYDAIPYLQKALDTSQYMIDYAERCRIVAINDRERAINNAVQEFGEELQEMKLITLGLTAAIALIMWQIKTENEAMAICQQTHSFDICATELK